MMTSFFSKTTAAVGAVGVLYGCHLSYNRYKLQTSETNDMLKRLQHVQDAFTNSEPLRSEDDAMGIFGRVKCMKPGPMNHLSNPHKPYTFIIGSHGLYNLSKEKTNYDKFMELGFERSWVEKQLAQGFTFNFYLFPGHSEQYKATLATWDGIFELLETNDPEIYGRIKGFKEEIQTTPFDEIESCAGFNFMDVDFEGPKNPNYLTKERFLQIEEEKITLCDVRFLLYCYLGLSKYYLGDGYTRSKNGERGSKEYLMKNTKLKDIEHLKTIHLNVELPPLQN